jgi:hypothetical protein
MSEKLRKESPKIPAESEESQEKLQRFPIIEDEGSYTDRGRPSPVEGSIVHYVSSYWGDPKDKINHRFILSKEIGGHPYLFKLMQGKFGPNSFTLQTETEGYGFATTNLDPKSSEELFRARAAFIESFTDYADGLVQRVESSPSGVSYSVEDVKECIDKILAHPDATYTREGLEYLSATYNGHQLFEMYRDLFGEYFHKEHPNERSRAQARSRLFGAMFKKYLENWEVEESTGSINIELRRKAAVSPAA